MTTMSQPPIRYIDRTREQYSALGHGVYEWAHNEDEPPAWTELTRPLDQSRLGLVATGGIYALGQTAFTHRDDTSYRTIPVDADPAALRVTHFAYDMTDARADVDVVFPIGTLAAMVAEGTIGELSPRAYTCMGGIYSRRRVRDELAPALIERLQADEVDAVLLVPV